MNVATALIANETAGCTLYELEDYLQALVNSIDVAQEPAIREFINEIGQEMRRVKEKAGRPRRISALLRISAEVCRRGNRAHSKAQSIHRACPRGIGIVPDPGGRIVYRTRSAAT
jgi:hypothetical protein